MKRFFFFGTIVLLFVLVAGVNAQDGLPTIQPEESEIFHLVTDEFAVLSAPTQSGWEFGSDSHIPTLETLEVHVNGFSFTAHMTEEIVDEMDGMPIRTLLVQWEPHIHDGAGVDLSRYDGVLIVAGAEEYGFEALRIEFLECHPWNDSTNCQPEDTNVASTSPIFRNEMELEDIDGVVSVQFADGTRSFGVTFIAPFSDFHRSSWSDTDSETYDETEQVAESIFIAVDANSISAGEHIEIFAVILYADEAPEVNDVFEALESVDVSTEESGI